MVVEQELLSLPKLPSFSQLLNQHRNELGIATYKLASGICDPSYLSRIANGSKHQPQLGVLDRLSRRFKLKNMAELEFYMSAGRPTSSLINTFPWKMAIYKEANLFSCDQIMASSKDHFSRVVTKIAKSYPKDTPEQNLPPETPIFRDYHRELREARNISRNRLGLAAGLFPENITRFENGSRGIPYKATLEKVADAMELKPEERFGLLLLGRYITDDLINSYPWLDCISSTVRFLNSRRISTASKADFTNKIAFVALNWQASGL